MLKAVIFDLDDTLLWDHKSVSEAFKSTCAKAVEKYDIDPLQLEENVRKHAEDLYPTYETYKFVSNIGIGTFEGMWGEFQDEGEAFQKLRETVPLYRKQAWLQGLKDLDIEDEELAETLAKTFPEERKKHIFLYDETLEVLDALKGKYKLLMLTNGSPHLQHTKLSLSPEIEPYFDHIVISGDFGSGKPSTELFNYALSLLEVEKREVIMVGDNPLTDILGASKIGIDSIWINHHNKELTEVTPTYEVSRLKEIMPIIKSLNE
ncbi:HAD family hydrolase [Pseudogracilibacillus auburnensis]|uniref:Phosphoserine phosphatase n=1 Tax=Pseudogracilibacillus auburnensis TaxID=1494959 RepID=A0A2V3W5U1_9BACI|nr:HAD family hydrolase [Pseudogracilibacillus auburnensis]MBO1001586.1 HAD family hydrolase [Pseudogracilibacillus auburnensis]PXW89492.1 putative hydrolase of the HAD superfamily [Pseudogracilibacillus auburnensis]